MHLTVRFDRYTQDNEDDDIAAENFPEISDPELQLLEQFKCELNGNRVLKNTWNVLAHRVVDENLFHVWVGFDWNGEGVEFCKALQNTYDEFGMSGFYEVLDATGPDKGHVELLKKWFKQVYPPKSDTTDLWKCKFRATDPVGKTLTNVDDRSCNVLVLTSDPKLLVGKTLTNVDDRSCNVLVLTFDDGSVIMVESHHDFRGLDRLAFSIKHTD